ncbi:hypothetical protein SDC9_152665 [bioreactor metagenome]|uniref:Uncharacterized protein n=1 Tax=bioreactor metagenome TaxID=1076179 RepID=A0A645ETQ7_9ZZZZ
MFTLMSKDKEVLKFNISKTFIQNVELVNVNVAPEMLKRGNISTLEQWLSERSVDITMVLS